MASCPAFYQATNGVTVLCPAAAVGDTGVVDGVTYTKRDRAALNALVTASPTDEVELARSCTTGVTDLSELFGEALGSKVSDPTTFNPDLSSWDVSSVTDMNSMVRVRVHLACCCCSRVAVSFSSPVPYPLAPRSPLTPHGRPSLAAM